MDFSTQKPQATGANKKLKRNLRETDSEDEVESPFPRFITIESKSSPITSLSLFIIKKVILSNITPKSVKRLKNDTLLVEVEKENMRIFCWKWQCSTILQSKHTLTNPWTQVRGWWGVKNCHYVLWKK